VGGFHPARNLQLGPPYSGWLGVHFSEGPYSWELRPRYPELSLGPRYPEARTNVGFPRVYGDYRTYTQHHSDREKLLFYMI